MLLVCLITQYPVRTVDVAAFALVLGAVAVAGHVVVVVGAVAAHEAQVLPGPAPAECTE